MDRQDSISAVIGKHGLFPATANCYEASINEIPAFTSPTGKVYQGWWGIGCCHTLLLLFGSGARWIHSRDVGTFHFRANRSKGMGEGSEKSVK